MSSWDGECRRKLNDDFENVFREHDRLRQDLNSDQNQQYQLLLNSIDKWEQNAIKKIQKTAKNARNDAQKLLKDTNQQLQRVLNDTVTEELRDALEQKNNFTEFHINKWLGYLSEIRKQLEAISSTVNFTHHKVIHLIKIKRKFSLSRFGQINLDYHQFDFEKICGHPTFYNTEHLINTDRPATIVSQNTYSTGTHYFRFRVEQTTNELFFGIINNTDIEKLKQNIHPRPSIHGWWNIDRCVLKGRKEPYVSSLNIYNGDEVILILNCAAREIFLEYPSMSKLNSIKLADDVRDCLPWQVLIEIGKPGECLLRLVDWGTTAHVTNQPNRQFHCFCTSN
ncbi:unnamed protein product [Didymodactylos carnosus]|uniref:Uncharacterized protein n=1 Tax=Didymodactylos carnosus TaxID=1234261 RepID=A0A815YT40_9BILA|nr:unnamed protein product [Didymodactylos carnosus]CAF1575867.1 unnamed protein product [Didymodactylos carnosus]CAF4281272.1 unnamed protein product [Didymodactylos carnosus]CAF4440813.1 unnamed protein product [Didymodactylos carnosus]